ncbi:MAG TPA: MBL fold metallo-hydrolase [Anaerolineae bacterium]|jgi:phosphoribosyl 1,2-cyclic phosphodiesterase|nr:MBL fold metallo-hydrolase [Anaerolineae bacterium]
MQVTLWGTRGSVPTPGPDKARYGGNTSCVSVTGNNGSLLVLDAGTGILPLGASLTHVPERVDILLTHLHLDHIQGLGFFGPLRRSKAEVHIWGPASTTLSLSDRLSRYLSPPLFPIYIRDLPSRVVLHEVAQDQFQIGEFTVNSAMVFHLDPTVGYRVASADGVMVYIPDHEPALGTPVPFTDPEWTSGYDLAAGADLLIHDCQYTLAQYKKRIGWGHSAIPHAFQFGQLTQVRHFVPFHHDPKHSDNDLDRLLGGQVEAFQPSYEVTPARDGLVFELNAR